MQSSDTFAKGLEIISSQDNFCYLKSAIDENLGHTLLYKWCSALKSQGLSSCTCRPQYMSRLTLRWWSLVNFLSGDLNFLFQIAVFATLQLQKWRWHHDPADEGFARAGQCLRQSHRDGSQELDESNVGFALTKLQRLIESSTSIL